MPTLEDAELLEAIATRQSREAFEELYARYEASACSLARYLAGKPLEIEEVVQDAMFRVWRYAHTYDPAKGSPRSWILRIVARQCTKAYRKSRRKQAAMTEALTTHTPSARGSGAAHATPPEQAEQGEVLAALHRLLEEMPLSDRRLVALAFGAGLTHEEIAEALALPRRTVSYQVQRSLEQLRAGLAALGFAALTPLLESGKLGEALCSGGQIPAGLKAGVMQGLETALAEGTRQAVDESIRATAVWKSSALLKGAIAGILVAAGAAGIGIWKFSGTAPGVPPAEILAARVPGAEGREAPVPLPAEEARVARVWNFRAGAPLDLKPNVGGWEWRRDEETGEGAMFVLDKDEVSMVLPDPGPQHPFLVKASVQSTVRKGLFDIKFASFWGLSRADSLLLKATEKFTRNPDLDAFQWHEMRAYYRGPYVCAYADRRLVSVSACQATYTQRKVFIGFGGKLKIREISMQSISEEAFLRCVGDPEQLASEARALKDPKQTPVLRLSPNDP